MECTVGSLLVSDILMLILNPGGLSSMENEVAHEKWCNDLAAKFLCIFVLDRFSDFVSDQVRMFPCIHLSVVIEVVAGGRPSQRNCFSDSGLPSSTHAPAIASTRALNAITNDSTGFFHQYDISIREGIRKRARLGSQARRATRDKIRGCCSS